MQYDNIKQTQSTYLLSIPFIPIDILIIITIVFPTTLVKKLRGII